MFFDFYFDSFSLSLSEAHLEDFISPKAFPNSATKYFSLPWAPDANLHLHSKTTYYIGKISAHAQIACWSALSLPIPNEIPVSHPKPPCHLGHTGWNSSFTLTLNLHFLPLPLSTVKFLSASLLSPVKNPPAMEETACNTWDPVWSLGREIPLEEER